MLKKYEKVRTEAELVQNVIRAGPGSFRNVSFMIFLRKGEPVDNKIELLDCTLRDGGYINNWKWGADTAKKIIEYLVSAGIDTVETGFLRNTDVYSQDMTVCSRIEGLNYLLPEHQKGTKFSAMAMCSNYDIRNLSDYSGIGIEIIRVTAHENDIQEGIEFAKKIMQKGYKTSINPINIMGYSDDLLLKVLEKVNESHTYQFAIVDTFGSMKRRDLDRIISLADHNLSRDIRIAVHLHENMAQSFSLAQSFVDRHLDRPVAVDGSLLGMGRIPGNLPTELIADYLNEYCGRNYDIDFLLDAIQDHISRIKGETRWGYDPAYFLSAKYNLHRNYAEYYLEKGDLIARDMNHLLSRFDPSKASVFDVDYAEQMYLDYMDNRINDSQAVQKLKKDINRRRIMILAPGRSAADHTEVVKKYIKEEQPVVIAVNFFPDNYKADYVFFGNNRRYSQSGKIGCRTIASSNVKGDFDYYIDHNSISGAYKQGNNALVMLLTLLKRIGCGKAAVAGADGYIQGEKNYCSDTIRSSSSHGRDHNLEIASAIKKTGIQLDFITKSVYQDYI